MLLDHDQKNHERIKTIVLFLLCILDKEKQENSINTARSEHCSEAEVLIVWPLRAGLTMVGAAKNWLKWGSCAAVFVEKNCVQPRARSVMRERC